MTDRLDWFAGHFDEVVPLPLVGEWRGFFKLRIGDIRVIYKIEWASHKIIIYAIGPRDKIYKWKS